tara:strand:+ start:13459 stop:13725 length:267 start_codon:yes stop_codon:yes gene_type:complete
MAKRKKNKIKKIDELQELEGYRLGDIIYAKIVTDEVRKGEIMKFYPDDSSGPAFMFLDAVDSKYLISKIEWIIDKPTAAQKKKALKSR